MRRFIHAALAAAAALAIATPAMAQMSANPAEIGQKIKAMGQALSPEVVGGTNALYAPLLAKQSHDGVTLTSNVKYGDAERNVLDIYAPSTAAETKLPILLFVHGGGFVRGDKAGAANIGYYFAQRGIVTMPINYRFAPDSTWPAGGEDIASVIKWVHDNPDAHGGDVNHIFLAGNSAGATHVATYAFFEDLQVKDDGVAGAIIISIPTADTANLDMQKDTVYYGTDVSKFSERSVIEHIGGRKIPVLLSVAEYDMPSINQQNHALIDALYQRDKKLPDFITALGHNHISIVGHIGTADESLAPEILEFIRAHIAD